MDLGLQPRWANILANFCFFIPDEAFLVGGCFWG
jgi:hypothetical protein